MTDAFDPASIDDLDSVARSFQTSRLPAISLTEPFAMSDIAELRRALERAPFDSFDLAHRGHYEHSTFPLYESIASSLRAVVEAVVGGRVAIAHHRWLRFRRGDYSLVRDDVPFPEKSTGAGLELTLDVSAEASGEAEVVYAHRGQSFFTMAQRPGELGVVERGPTVSRYDRYLTHRVGEAIVYRLRAALTRVD